tara:strand:+ start:1527 stop:2261 length:735 start_codon:yes stop_codon:yes gene_type:complete
MKIVVCGVSIGEDYNKKPWVKNALENHRVYCKKHDYTYVLRTIPKTDRVATWEKLDLILELMENTDNDVLFWMDTDSVFTNFKIKIESLLDSNNDFYFSGDTNIINAGHFIFKNTKWSKKQLRHIWDICPANYGMGLDNAAMSVWLGGGNGNMSHEEQKCIYESVDRGYLDKNEQSRIESGLASNYICTQLKDKVKLLPKNNLNSYPRDWVEGDFILHVVNSNDGVRNSLIVSPNPTQICLALL